MESEASWLLHFLRSPLSFLVFSVIITIFICYFSCFYLVKPRVYCKCDICQTYITSSWRLQFHNLCDWYTHLLQNSPTKTIHIHVLNNTITANPANVEFMLKTKFDNYPKGKSFSTILGDLLGRGIFNVDGESWRFQRKIASLELGRASIRSIKFFLQRCRSFGCFHCLFLVNHHLLFKCLHFKIFVVEICNNFLQLDF